MAVYEPWFDRPENKSLVAICARNTIRNIGIGGVIWGLLNTGLGVVALADTLLNICLVLLGLLMLVTGIVAMARPTLNMLLAEAIVSVLLFIWNVGVTILNTMAGADFNPRGLIFPLIIAIVFFSQYFKLGYLRGLIGSLQPEEIKRARGMAKTIFKEKTKENPLLVAASGAAVRVQLMDNAAFCALKDLSRAFHMTREDFLGTIDDVQAKKIRMVVAHPLGKLTYNFNAENSQKIRQWASTAPLAAEVNDDSAPTPDGVAPPPHES